MKNYSLLIGLAIILLTGCTLSSQNQKEAKIKSIDLNPNHKIVQNKSNTDTETETSSEWPKNNLEVKPEEVVAEFYDEISPATVIESDKMTGSLKDEFNNYKNSWLIYCAQEKPNATIYELIDIDQENAKVIAHHIYGIFASSARDNYIIIELKKIHNQWKIDKINCQN